MNPISVCFLFAGLCVAGSSNAQLSTVRDADCHQIVYHIPADDVAFVPGVDVSGNPVAPADLNSGYGITAPEEVTIDIRLDLARRLGLGEGVASALIGGEGVVGQVRVKGQDLYWNGALLPRDNQAALLEACGAVLTAAGIPLPTEKPAPSLEKKVEKQVE